MLKRFPLKARLSVTFGLLFVVSMTIINIISIRSSRLTLEKQAASQLTEISFCHFHRFSDQNHRETTKKTPPFF